MINESQRTLEVKANSVLGDAQMLTKEYQNRKLFAKRASSNKVFKIY